MAEAPPQPLAFRRVEFEVEAPATRASVSARPRPSLLDFEPGLAQLQRKSSAVGDGPLSVGRTTTLTTAMNLVTVMIGAGVLTFPKVFSRGGWLVSPVILLVSAVASAEVGMAMVESLKFIELRLQAGVRYSFRRPETFENMVEAAFGRLGASVASVAFNTFLLLVSGAYMILIGTSLQFLTNCALPYRLWVLICTLFFGGLVLLKDMAFISKLSMVGVIASFTYVIAIGEAGITASLANRGKPDFEERTLPESIKHVGSVLSVMFFGFNFQVVTATVRSEMLQPDEMSRAVRGAVFVVTWVYMCVGLLGFWGWGCKVNGNVLKSMVNAGDNSRMVAGILLSMAVIANLFVTLPIVMNVVCVALEARCGLKYSPPLRLFLLGIAVAVGLFCPFFLEVLGLIASILGTVIMAFIPLMVFWKLAPRTGEPGHPSLFVGLKHGAITLLAFVAMTFGTRSALADLAVAMQDPNADPIAHFFLCIN